MGWAVRLVAAWRRDIVCAGPAAGRRVALTLDDGPDPVVTPRVLDVLARHGARATFFLIGERARGARRRRPGSGFVGREKVRIVAATATAAYWARSIPSTPTSARARG